MRLTQPADGVPLRLSASTDPEQVLCDAAAAGRELAIRRLASWFPELNLDALARSADGDGAALLTIGRDSNSSPMLDEFDALVARVAALGPRVRASKDARADAPGLLEAMSQRGRGGQPVLDPVRAAAELSEGTTLTLNDVGADLASLHGICNDLQRALVAGVQVNVYLSEADAPGFGQHWDDHDVIILQAKGSKYWEIFWPGALNPSKGLVSREASGASVWAGVLHPAQALYIPRGWPHSVKGFTGDVSAHFTIGIHRTKLVDLLPALFNSDPGEWSTDPINVESALAAKRRELVPYRSSGVVAAATALSGNGVVTMDLPGGAIFADADQSAGCDGALGGPGGMVQFTKADLPVLSHLAAGETAYSEAHTAPEGPTISNDDLAVLSAAGLVQCHRDG